MRTLATGVARGLSAGQTGALCKTDEPIMSRFGQQIYVGLRNLILDGACDAPTRRGRQDIGVDATGTLGVRRSSAEDARIEAP